MKTISNIGDFLKERRLDIGYSSSELGKKIKKSKAYVSRVEKGTLTPSLETLCLFARYLHFSLDEVILDDLTLESIGLKNTDLYHLLKKQNVLFKEKELSSYEKNYIIDLLLKIT